MALPRTRFGKISEITTQLKGASDNVKDAEVNIIARKRQQWPCKWIHEA